MKIEDPAELDGTVREFFKGSDLLVAQEFTPTEFDWRVGILDGNPLYVLHEMRQTELAWPAYEADAIDDAGDGDSIRAPIIGRVAKVFVKPGDAVAKGDRVAVVEAMKMEHVLHAPRAGKIARLAAKEGDQVTQGALIVALAEA